MQLNGTWVQHGGGLVLKIKGNVILLIKWQFGVSIPITGYRGIFALNGHNMQIAFHYKFTKMAYIETYNTYEEVNPINTRSLEVFIDDCDDIIDHACYTKKMITNIPFDPCITDISPDTPFAENALCFYKKDDTI